MDPYNSPAEAMTGEPFEEVDRIPEQDEEVSTTAFTGEEAEEDRYEPGLHEAAASGASDNLLNFDDDYVVHSSERTPVSENSDLLNMGSPAAPVPSAPPLVPVQAVSNSVGDPDLLGEFGASDKKYTPSEPESSSFTHVTKKKSERVEVSKPPTVMNEAPSSVDTWLKNVDPRAEGTRAKDMDDGESMGGVHSPYEDQGQGEVIGTDFTPAPVSSIAEEEAPTLLSSRILDLIYWRDLKKTGVVFGSMLFILMSLAIFSVLSVLAYLSLAVLAVTLSFTVYKKVLQAVQKSGDAHPFRQYLDKDIEITSEQAENVVANVLRHVNNMTRELRRLFLIEDIVDSLKFALLLWVLTYIGSWFNGMTLIILGVVSIFTLPKVYETYKVQIDNYVNLACTQVNNVVKQVQEKVPFLKKKEKKP